MASSAALRSGPIATCADGGAGAVVRGHVGTKVLPRSDHRRRPPTARAVGFTPYRLVVATDLTFHVFGPGVRDEQLSAYAEERRASAADVAVALRDIRHVLKTLNGALTVQPKARETMVRDVRGARGILKFYVKTRDWSYQRGRGQNDGDFIDAPTDAEAYEHSLTVLALSRFYRFLTERGEFPDQDPMRMDPSRSRLGAEEKRRLVRGDDGKMSLDTDLMFRTGLARRIAPNSGDPFFLERILAAGDKEGWPLVVRTVVLAKGLTGGRDFQLRPISIFNWLVLGKGDFIHAPGKYSHGKLEIRLRVSSRLKEALVALMDATYEHLGGYEGLLRLARSSKRKDELKRLFIFSLDGVGAVSYSFVNDGWFRPIIERAGLRFEDRGDGNDEPVMRHVVQHMLRHEFTNRILQRIDESGVSAKDKMVQNILLARYMGWKSVQAMLEYYGRWFFNREVDIFITAHIEAANDNSLPDALGKWDADAITAEEMGEVRGTMGGLLVAA